MEQYITYTARKKPASSASAVHAQAPAIAHLQAPALALAPSLISIHRTAKVINRKPAKIANHNQATAVVATNIKPYISSNYIINYAKDRMQSGHDCIPFLLRDP